MLSSVDSIVIVYPIAIFKRNSNVQTTTKTNKTNTILKFLNI